MSCSSSITFSHHRVESMMSGEQFTVTNGDLGELPTANIKDLAIDKTAEKVYVPYGNQMSYYIPHGMIGPIVKLELSVGSNIDIWRTVYTNDYLEVETFDNDMFNRTLAEGSNWWVDTIGYDTSSGKLMRYTVSLNLYLQTDV